MKTIQIYTDKTEPISISLPESLLEEFDNKLKVDQLKRSEVVQELIKLYVNQEIKITK